MDYTETPQKPLLHAVIQLVRKLDFELTEQRWQSSEYQQLRELEPLLYQMQKPRRLVHEEVA
jgi:hypothetical protein